MTPACRQSHHGRASAFVLTAGLLLSALTGCPGSLEGGPFPSAMSTGTGGITGGGTGGTSGVCDAPGTIFTPKCAVCHSVSTAPDFTAADIAGVLVGKAPNLTCPGPTPQYFVNPTKPAGGVLFTRLMGDTCVDQMPQGGPFLSPTEMQCVTDWVTSKLPP